MYTKTITYEDFLGETVTEDFLFNLTKAELIEEESKFEGSLSNQLQTIVANKDTRGLIAWTKKIILMSYGKVSEDGRRFIKSKEMTEEFYQTEAYSEIFFELTTNEEEAMKFVKAVLPKDLVVDINSDLEKLTSDEKVVTKKTTKKKTSVSKSK